jgi:hypothetical protein
MQQMQDVTVNRKVVVTKVVPIGARLALYLPYAPDVRAERRHTFTLLL